MKHIVVFGNPIDGLTFEGPFDDFESAEAYATGFDDWWIAALSEPVSLEGDT